MIAAYRQGLTRDDEQPYPLRVINFTFYNMIIYDKLVYLFQKFEFEFLKINLWQENPTLTMGIQGEGTNWAPIPRIPTVNNFY